MNKWQTTSAKIIGIGLIPMIGISFTWAQDINQNKPADDAQEEIQIEEDLSSLYGGEMSMQSETEPDIHVGQVLINKTTADPRFHLDVNGAITGASFASYNPLNGAGQNGAVMVLNWYNNAPRIRIGGNGIGAGNGLDIQSVGNVSMMRIKSNGVGIGILNPNNTEHWNKVLDVHGTGHAKSIVTTNNIQTGIWSHDYGYYTALAGGMTGTKTNHPFSIITNKSAKVTILPNGKVGIGTQAPTEKLEVVGNIKLSGNIVSDGDICLGNCQ